MWTILIVELLLLARVNITKAEYTYWVGTTGDWFSPQNWMYQVPESGDRAYIENGGTAQITGGSPQAYWIDIGNSENSAGTIEHTGGTFDYIEYLEMGQESGSTGVYNLSGTAALFAGTEYLGRYGTATFNHTGGTHSCNHFTLSGKDTANTYNLSGTAQLSVTYEESIGCEGTGIFNHTGGTNSAQYIHLGEYNSSTGIYNLSGTGQVVAESEQVGYRYSGSTGVFNQTGGTNLSNILILNHDSQYNLSGESDLTVTDYETIGFDSGNAIFTQTAGTHTVNGKLRLGYENDSNGTYIILGGNLSAQDLQVGYWGRGHFRIDNSDVHIAVSDKLIFGIDSMLTAVEGSTIHLSGTQFDNWSTNQADLTGLNNLSFIFEGGSALGIVTFEVAGQDFGAISNGFVENFALDSLILGGEDIGQVQLIDWRENLPGTDALYVKNLELGDGSYLDLNGLNLYYLNSILDPGATVELNGGHFEQVFPIPGDFEPDGDVDFFDFATLALAWYSKPNDINWNAFCDISEPNDNIIDELDLKVFRENWLENTP